ncbi:MAG: hypothetical protein RJA16_700, partial [Planctomycetota bacterium]
MKSLLSILFTAAISIASVAPVP